MDTETENTEDTETISEINIILDSKFKKLIAEFKEKHQDLLVQLEEDWHSSVDKIQKLQKDIRELIILEIFNNVNLYIPKKRCLQPEVYATWLCLISPLENIQYWSDFNIKKDFIKIMEIDEKITDDLYNCVCCCGKTGCIPTNMGQVWNKTEKKYIMVGSKCLLKKELTDSDYIQKLYARKKAEAKAKAKAEAKAEAEAKSRAEAYAIAKAKGEAETRAKAEADAIAKAEAEVRAEKKRIIDIEIQEIINIQKKRIIMDCKYKDDIQQKYKEQRRINDIRENKISIIRSHYFRNITEKQQWEWHDHIQLYYDNKCETDYDNKLDDIITGITCGYY